MWLPVFTVTLGTHQEPTMTNCCFRELDNPISHGSVITRSITDKRIIHNQRQRQGMI